LKSTETPLTLYWRIRRGGISAISAR